MNKISPSSNTMFNQSSAPLKKLGKSILFFITQANQSPSVRCGQLFILGFKIIATQQRAHNENRAINLAEIVEIAQVASAAWLTPVIANKFLR
ncbi:MAG: hypothetical protein V4629_10530 [Pseudomonadota bacterium]